MALSSSGWRPLTENLTKFEAKRRPKRAVPRLLNTGGRVFPVGGPGVEVFPQDARLDVGEVDPPAVVADFGLGGGRNVTNCR
jgi:hypothetical protein